MDAEYLRTHIGGGWHRLYDGGHSLAGSWKAVSSSLPDLAALDQLGVWANEYWKDLITTRGMPILILDHADQVSEYFKRLPAGCGRTWRSGRAMNGERQHGKVGPLELVERRAMVLHLG
jgi:hypothetical protein